MTCKTVIVHETSIEIKYHMIFAVLLQMYISNLVPTTRFWKNLHQVHPKEWKTKLFKKCLGTRKKNKTLT